MLRLLGNMAVWRAIRDTAFFTVGITGAAHEIWWGVIERPATIGLIAMLLGLPVAMRLDEKKQGDGS